MARKKEILEAAFDAEGALDDLEWVPRYNVAPGQDIAVVRQDPTQSVRTMSQMRWGLPPTWTSNSSGSYKIINARSEDVLARPAFRESLHSRRCLIPADGFYEWKHEGKEKLPFCFTLADDSIFAFAGIWESSKNLQGLESCAILTTTSNELMRGVHNRMPVILPREAYEIWLDPYFKNPRGLQPLLKPLSPDLMRRYRVSQRVNQVKNDDSECAMKI